MRERLSLAFPLVLSAAIPVVGVLMTLLRLQEGDQREALLTAAATVLGAIVWILILRS